LHSGGEKQGACAPCVGDSKGMALQGHPAPNRPFAAATRQPRAPRARAYSYTSGSGRQAQPFSLKKLRLNWARITASFESAGPSYSP
jgi:hypothetical protein